MLKKLEWESKILDVKIANFNYEKLKDNKFEIANKIDNKDYFHFRFQFEN